MSPAIAGSHLIIFPFITVRNLGCESMPIRYPTEFVSLPNFEVAWERIARGSNSQYKRLFSHLYPSYRFALRTILKDLLSEVRAGRYRPSPATVVYFPKSTRILRPITLLSINDQVVYQAITNVIANKFYASLRPYYGTKTFGALYAGRNSLFFYRSWKKAYRAFNNTIRHAHRQGNDVVADFDLVSFFDLIDHTTLRTVLERRVKNGELLDLLFQYLGQWTAGQAHIYVRGHGIPQGPEASAFLAEVFLHDFDLSNHGKTKYLRYVDDVKLLGKTFGSVRRVLLRLDLKSKHLGLVPSAQKVQIRRVRDIERELKSIPSNIAGQSPTKSNRPLTKATKRRLQNLLKKSINKRRGDIVINDDTQLKFALYRLPPSIRIFNLVTPFLNLRPDLSGVLSHYAAGFTNNRRCAEVLYTALKDDPVFDATASDYVLALGRCAPKPEPTKYRGLIATLVSRSEEKSVLLKTAVSVYLYERATKSSRARLLSIEQSPLTASLVVHQLSLDPISASVPVSDLAQPIRAFARSNNPDLARYCTYLMLTELRLVPKGPSAAGGLLLKHLGLRATTKKISLLPGFVDDLFNVKVKLDWERVAGKKAHSEAQRRANLIRGGWKGNPSVLITLLDNFNDLLIQRLSMKHAGLRKAFKKASGPNKIPDFGNWLQHPDLALVLPISRSIFQECHKKRLVADVAHATIKKTGKFTRPIGYKEAAKVTRDLSRAYLELITEFRKL
jgi:Reverse transcriptase (RNA-dependent DNA polymerase)